MHTQPASGRAWLESVWTRHIAQEQGREGERKVSLSLCVPLSFDQAHGWIRQREAPSFSISAGLLQPPLYFLDESQFTMVRNGASSWQNISSREREIGLTPPWVVLGRVDACLVQTIAAGYEVWGRTDSPSFVRKAGFHYSQHGCRNAYVGEYEVGASYTLVQQFSCPQLIVTTTLSLSPST